jgi:hypothetical protein
MKASKISPTEVGNPERVTVVQIPRNLFGLSASSGVEQFRGPFLMMMMMMTEKIS